MRATEDDTLFTIGGPLGGTMGRGSFQIIESHTDGRGVCDRGVVGFGADRSP